MADPMKLNAAAKIASKMADAGANDPKVRPRPIESSPVAMKWNAPGGGFDKWKLGDAAREKALPIGGMLPKEPVPSYHKGIASVPKTGLAVVKKGEAIIPADRNPMNEGMYDKVPGMSGEKPKKEIDHIRIRKAKTGGHVIEHHHKHPEHHKMEEHLAHNNDELHNKVEAAMGTPNPGEGDPTAAGAPPPPPGGAISPPVGQMPPETAI